MAARFAALTDRYYGTTGLPAANVFSVALWFRLTSDRNTFSSPFGTNGSATDLLLTTDSDGTTFRCWDSVTNSAGFGGVALTVGTWYRAAVTVNGANCSFYAGAAGSPLTVSSVANFTGPNPPLKIVIGSDQFDEWLDGRVASFKMWQAVLTQAELEAELAQYVPVRQANLLRWHPLVGADLADYSGAGATLTAGTTAPTTEDGPPIPWTVAPTPQPAAPRRRAANF